VGDLTDQLGRAPSAAEIGDHLGITRLGARSQLQALEAKGLLKDIPKTVSSGQWALTEAGIKARCDD
jgi:predicted ArsR family transcriptional regulator